MTETSLNELARSAVDGDRAALSELAVRIQHPLYRLSLRFLGHPQDAQDATQEILIRVITRLGTFEGRSEMSSRRRMPPEQVLTSRPAASVSPNADSSLAARCRARVWAWPSRRTSTTRFSAPVSASSTDAC